MTPPISGRGLAWPWNNPKTHFTLYAHAISTGTITWLTNWELWKPDGCPSEMEYVPMLRTAKELPNLDPFLSSLWPFPRAAGENRHFLTLNEPDIPSQANLSPEQALEIFRTNILPARSKFKFRLGAPAVSSSPEGLSWLREFWGGLTEQERGKIAFLPLHWYGTSLPELTSYLHTLHAEFRLPLWVTEYAYVHMDRSQSTTPWEVEGFLAESCKLLDGLGFVERYAWFGAMDEPGEWTGREIALSETMGHGEGTLRRLGRMYCEGLEAEEENAMEAT